jgi:hypothetical protein
MTVKNLREYLETLPLDFDGTNLVFRTIRINPEDEEDVIFSDVPLSACGIDIESAEMCFYDDESADILDEYQED